MTPRQEKAKEVVKAVYRNNVFEDKQGSLRLNHKGLIDGMVKAIETAVAEAEAECAKLICSECRKGQPLDNVLMHPGPAFCEAENIWRFQGRRTGDKSNA